MLRFTRLQVRSALVAAVLASVLPAALAAQAATTSGTTAAAAAKVGIDPWLVNLGSRTSVQRTNLGQLDRALEPYRAKYAELDAADRARMRQAFEELLPKEQFNRYKINLSQARAIAYLALGPEPVRRNVPHDPRDRGTGRWDRAEAVLDSLSRDAAWIRSTALALGRTGSSRSRAEERAALVDMAERARGIALGGPRWDCDAVNPDAEQLRVATREAVDVFDGSSFSARLALGSTRIQRITTLADSVERTLFRCLTAGR